VPFAVVPVGGAAVVAASHHISAVGDGVARAEVVERGHFVAHVFVERAAGVGVAHFVAVEYIDFAGVVVNEVAAVGRHPAEVYARIFLELVGRGREGGQEH